MRLKHLLVFTAAIVFESAAYCQSWNLTSLFSFPGGAGGGNPNYLMLAPDGSIIGTTTIANTKDCTTCGTVYRLVPPSGGTGAWTHTVLFGFPDQATDGEQPNSVVLGPGGVLYGATGTGGPSTCGGLGCGTIFELTSGTTPWTETVLLDFNGDRGQSPGGPLRLGHNGALYGTASQLVYDLVPPTGGTGPWAEHRLYAFTGDGTDASSPTQGVVIGAGNVLYGASIGGGTVGLGTVYQLTPPSAPGGAWTENVLYSFQGGTDGSVPEGPLAISSTGVLYGTTLSGGSTTCFQKEPQTGCGTVYQLTPPASPRGTWTESVLYKFTDGTDGGYPVAGVAIGAGGALFGTTAYGGTGSCEESCGTVFQLLPPTTPGGTWTESAIYSFAAGTPGGGAITVIAGPAGVLYGISGGGAHSQGQAFELAP
jgi:hypothetical protein